MLQAEEVQTMLPSESRKWWTEPVAVQTNTEEEGTSSPRAGVAKTGDSNRVRHSVEPLHTDSYNWERLGHIFN